MAEFCLDCWNEINQTNDPTSKYIFSKELDLCERCGELKYVIITTRKNHYRRKLRFVILPFRIIRTIFYVLWRLLTLPYWFYKYKKDGLL